MRALRVAAVNLAVRADRADNLVRAARLIEAAANEGAKLVALPECFTGKYGVQHFRDWQEPLDGGEPAGGAAVMSECAKRLGITVLGGIIEREAGGERLFNSIAAFGPDGGLLANYRKTHLSRVLGVTSESDVLTSGDDPVSFDAPSASALRVGMACCFDLRFPTFLRRYGPQPPPDGGAAADVLVAPSAFLDVTGVDHWDLLVRRAALDGQCFVVAPNVAYDSADAVPLHGRSLVADPWGRVLAQTGAEGDDLAVADVDGTVVDEIRKKLPIVPLARWAA